MAEPKTRTKLRAEIPYTRLDMLAYLDGCGPHRLMHYFLDAANGQRETFLHSMGWDYEDQDDFFVYRQMRDYPGAYFMVPDYFYIAMAAAQDVEEGGVVRFHGIRLVPWNREFIVARCDTENSAQTVQ